MISFELSEEQAMIRQTANDFAEKELKSQSRDCDEKDAIPQAVLQSSWELGLVNAPIPEEYGGVGMDRSAVTGAIMSEALAGGDLSMAIAMLTPSLFAYPIMDCGTEAQKKEYLPKFADANFFKATAAVVEPTMDFDLSDLTCKAEKKSSGYVLNGKKCFVPLGTEAELFLVYASLGQAGYENVGGFIVEKGAKGLTVSERERNMGLKALDTAELTLDNVEVSAEARLGGENGCDFSRLMNYSRIALSAMAVGIMQATLDYTLVYAKDRIAFGEPIATKQAVAFMLAEMAIEVESARNLIWEAAWKLDQGMDALKDCYLAKMYTDQAAMKICDYGVQLLGGHGYIREHPVELWFRNARGFATFEGMATV